MKLSTSLFFIIGAVALNATAQEVHWIPAPKCNDSWTTTVSEVKSEEQLSNPSADLLVEAKEAKIQNPLINRNYNIVTFARKAMFFVKPTAANQKWTLAIRTEAGGQIAIGTIEDSVTEEIKYWSQIESKNKVTTGTCYKVQLYPDVQFSDQSVGRKWSAGAVALIIPVTGTTEQISLKVTAYDESTGRYGSALSKPEDGTYRLLGILK